MLRYGQFCPVAKTAEIFADRWTPLIVRELCFQPCAFGELITALPLISRTMLAQRLKELADAEIIVTEPKSRGRGHIYRLTPAGEEFRGLIEMMFSWGQRWAFRRVGPEDLDTFQPMLGGPRHVDPADMPTERTVVRFEFRGIPKASRSPPYWWWIIQRPDIDICLKNPGHEVDLVVRADLAAFSGVFLGQIGLREALEQGKLGFEGSTSAVACLCRLLRLSNERMPRTFAYARPRAAVTIPARSAAA